MFEDIIKTRTKEIPIETDYTTVCPYCKSSIIGSNERRALEDGTWVQSLYCDTCGNPWTIVYNEDQSFSHIVYDTIRVRKNKRVGGRNG
jgi:ribosomal protein L37AE/L43A